MSADAASTALEGTDESFPLRGFPRVSRSDGEARGGTPRGEKIKTSIVVVGAALACSSGCAKSPAAESPAAESRPPSASTSEVVVEPPSDAPDAGAPVRTVEAGPVAPATKSPSLGVAECDRYIDNYERCEPTLRPKIQAGDMIAPRNERVRLQFLMKNEPGPDYGQVCAVLDRELSKICGGGAP